MAAVIRTRKQLEDKIKEIFEIDTISLLISNQITKYVREHKYSYLEIARALYYFFDVKGNDISKSQDKGIAIVPFVMDDARKYFRDLEKQIVEQSKQAQELKEKEKNVIICNKPEKKRKRNNIINIQNIREDDR